MKQKYIKRIIETTIDRKLKTSGAVLITGPKYCGKTTTAGIFAKTIHSFATPSDFSLYSIDISLVFKGDKPILIDEWQNIPIVWDEIRNHIDSNFGAFNQFLLTGSVQPKNADKIMHSGEGRFSKVIMYPFSLFESGDSTGDISLKDLFDGKKIKTIKNKSTLEDIAFYICRGGWPTSISLDRDYALDISENYYQMIFDYKNGAGNKYFPHIETAKLILKSYARNISSEAPYSVIKKDILKNDNVSLDDETIFSYIEKLNKLYIIEDLLPWNVNIRSKAKLRTSPIRHFVDTSLACTALGIYPNDLLKDFNTFGLFFEDMCIRDLRIYANSINATVSHYRDSYGLECDAIIHKRNGDWGAFEIKLGGEQLIKEAITNLLNLKNNIPNNKPKFLAVLVGHGNSYITKEGIYIIPIDLLKN